MTATPRPRVDLLAVRCDDCGAGPGDACYDLRFGDASEPRHIPRPHWIRRSDARVAGVEVAS